MIIQTLEDIKFMILVLVKVFIMNALQSQYFLMSFSFFLSHKLYVSRLI